MIICNVLYIYSKIKTNQKSAPKNREPYQKPILNKDRCIITDIPEYSLTQKLFNIILSSDKIKLRYPNVEYLIFSAKNLIKS